MKPARVKSNRKSITISRESYFKLLELKAIMGADTWDEMIDKLWGVVSKKRYYQPLV